MNKAVGFAMCGSFCTFTKVIPQILNLKKLNYDIIPIMSEMAYNTDTRFGKANEFIEKIEEICSHEIIHTIHGAEPIGPNKLLDVLVIAPCTGNTLGKLANGITDTSVTMAAKSHFRNGRPVLIAVSTNDGLSTAAQNIGKLINNKNIYFVPFVQDDSVNKPNSIISDYDKIPQAVEFALKNKQIQPLLQ